MAVRHLCIRRISLCISGTDSVFLFFFPSAYFCRYAGHPLELAGKDMDELFALGRGLAGVAALLHEFETQQLKFSTGHDLARAAQDYIDRGGRSSRTSRPRSRSRSSRSNQ